MNMSPLSPLKMSRYRVFMNGRRRRRQLSALAGAIPLRAARTLAWIRRGALRRQGVDLTGGVASAKAVVDVDHAHPAAATAQHPEKGRETTQVRPVTDAGRHGDDRPGHQSG